MRCSASLLALLSLFATGPAVGQAPAADGDVSALIADAIAARWGVDAALVALDWDTARAPAGVRSFRLSGSGADGAWLVTFETADAARAFVVRAGMRVDEAVAAHDLERGLVLEPSDMDHRNAVRWGPPVRDAAMPVPGWETQRRIRAGEPLRPPAVEPPLAVHAGDAVHMEFVRGAVSVTTMAQAAGSARVGETVFIRTETGRRLSGTVVAPGRVRVGSSQEEA
jgi:flagella basal body P-ring formation protein FlgA